MDRLSEKDLELEQEKEAYRMRHEADGTQNEPIRAPGITSKKGVYEPTSMS